MRVDEADIDLHGWLRSFYACGSLGRSFVMDNAVQRPIPTYANFAYNRQNYVSILKEVLDPLGLKLVQGKFVDAVVQKPQHSESNVSLVPPVASLFSGNGVTAPSPVAAAAVTAVTDSGSVSPVPVVSDSAKPVSPPPARRLRAKASGLLKSSAKRLGVSYNEVLASASAFAQAGTRKGVNAAFAQIKTVWDAAAIASDSLGSLDFARIVDFSAWDTARVVFGGEIRREDSQIHYENGQSVTQYSSVFDGLTVDVVRERWSFLWRRDGSILEVPGSVGSCASGSSKVSFIARKGIPFLDAIPGLRWLFSYEQKYDDELLVTVCLEEVENGVR